MSGDPRRGLHILEAVDLLWFTPSLTLHINAGKPVSRSNSSTGSAVLERGPALPYGVGGIQCVIFGLWTFE